MTINSKITVTLDVEETTYICSALLFLAQAHKKSEKEGVKKTLDGEKPLSLKMTHLAEKLGYELYNYKSDDPEDHCGS